MASESTSSQQSSHLSPSSKVNFKCEDGENYINDALTFVQPHTISAVSFQKPLASEVALTSHMLKDHCATITQPKAPTDLKPQKKRIPPSSKLKSLYKVRVILPKKQVAETQHAEETVATADVTQSLEASESAKDQVLDQNVQEESPYDTESWIKIIKKFQPRQSDDDAQIMFLSAEPSPFKYVEIKSTKHGESDSDSGLCSMPDDDLVSLTCFETLNSAGNDSQEGTAETLNAFADMPAQSEVGSQCI
ncbi:hypothetical protein Tco_0149608 [Tanacetum coccineum]